MTREEARARGWENLDIILVTGDCYVDHPSFGVAVVGRYLESLGLHVGVIASPDTDKIEDFKQLGRPNMFFGVTSGNLDSMIMRHTATKKHRSDDAYADGGLSGRRPARATIVYCNRIRQAFKDVRIVIGGLEASLRRFAHYDYWSDKVRRSVLPDSKADLLVYGMAERPLGQIVAELRKGKDLKEVTNVRGTAVMIPTKSDVPLASNTQYIPSFEEVSSDKISYAKAARAIHINQFPHSARPLIQEQAGRKLLVNPPTLPLTTQELDSIYALPFTRMPHPSHKGRIPAFEMIRFSVTAMRGCFGGCSFCALTVHQGRAIQSRSEDSIIGEIKKISLMQDFKGYISDIGGPTANMYQLVCGQPAVEAACRRISCVYPAVCSRLVTDHGPLIEVLKKARDVKGVKKVFVASGVRYDLANLSPDYIRELAVHHVSGQLKVAPEHSDPKTLGLMRKPPIDSYEKFVETFLDESRKAGLDQYVIPYFISAHPGCGLAQEVEMASYLKSKNLRPRQVQDFIPAPMTLAADMYHAGIDPMSGRKVDTDKGERDRRLHRALMQYFKAENYEDVRVALRQTGRDDLIGQGSDKLTP